MITKQEESVGYLFELEKKHRNHAAMGPKGDGPQPHTHPSKAEVTQQLAKIKRTEMSNHDKIREARNSIDSILDNPNATPKQHEQAKRYSTLLEKYETELPEKKEAMNPHEKLVLTEEEMAILTFSVFAVYPRLYWENNPIWSSMWFEYQKSMIEQKQELMR